MVGDGVEQHPALGVELGVGQHDQGGRPEQLVLARPVDGAELGGHVVPPIGGRLHGSLQVGRPLAGHHQPCRAGRQPVEGVEEHVQALVGPQGAEGQQDRAVVPVAERVVVRRRPGRRLDREHRVRHDVDAVRGDAQRHQLVAELVVEHDEGVGTPVGGPQQRRLHRPGQPASVGRTSWTTATTGRRRRSTRRATRSTAGTSSST